MKSTASGSKADPQGQPQFATSPYFDPGFSVTLVTWQKQHGRHGLPWQQSREAYRVWLSEIMLQQTQVTAVIPYYQRFLETFPTVFDLAAAPVEQVMEHWSGLGYYTRARNLHQCAKQVVDKYQGIFPADPAALQELPGIGRSTAAAITAFSYGTVAAILDGNVKRVFARVFGIDGYPGTKPVEDNMWLRAQALLPAQDIGAYTQGLMDLGATVCTRSSPKCPQCPFQPRCVAYAQGRTAELPVRKPKKAQKEKQVIMLLLQDGAEVWLERRPPTGIWGGLLSLPELAGMQETTEDTFSVDAQMTTVRARASRFGDIASIQVLPVFAHVFTHFKLHILPVHVQLKKRHLEVADSEHGWHALDDAAQLGLPAPVKTLLTSFGAQASLAFTD
ncbi:A/G-specific adenine glycosylase [Undibacterium sp.]|uniref:A/G-specific adenine glycosylase n=1 Tax=Undibacterium sp. TaxID=1914977 RepID=UPI00273154FF|nr:A/G-specific adenine glycosylase [Undibacterium sp.]MDP1979198.1 A/G-specific adenine glycosylase [Undibacterium sp.]